MNIHSTAIISKDSKIDKSVKIGAYTIIEKDVFIDSGTIIAPYVHITGNTKIGKNNKIYTGAVIGYQPQDLSFDPNKNVGITIGNNNTIREHVTIHLSTQNNSVTRIGDNCYLMVGSHIAHDCIIEDNVTLVNNALLAGYVIAEKNAFISGHAGIHQFCRIGAYSMVGANEKIGQDVVPFTIINNFPGVPIGINIVGLKRAGFTSEQRNNLRKAYRILFREGLIIPKALERLKREFDDPNITYMIKFIKESKRGIIKYKS